MEAPAALNSFPSATDMTNVKSAALCRSSVTETNNSVPRSLVQYFNSDTVTPAHDKILHVRQGRKELTDN